MVPFGRYISRITGFICAALKLTWSRIFKMRWWRLPQPMRVRSFNPRCEHIFPRFVEAQRRRWSGPLLIVSKRQEVGKTCPMRICCGVRSWRVDPLQRHRRLSDPSTASGSQLGCGHRRRRTRERRDRRQRGRRRGAKVRGGRYKSRHLSPPLSL
jgi:hypothetical protein